MRPCCRCMKNQNGHEDVRDGLSDRKEFGQMRHALIISIRSELQSLDINVREAFLKLKLKVKSLALVYTVFFLRRLLGLHHIMCQKLQPKSYNKNGRIYFSFKCSNMIDIILHLFEQEYEKRRMRIHKSCTDANFTYGTKIINSSIGRLLEV